MRSVFALMVMAIGCFASVVSDVNAGVSYSVSTGVMTVTGIAFAENQYGGKVQASKDTFATITEPTSYESWADTLILCTFSPTLASGNYLVRIYNGDYELSGSCALAVTASCSTTTLIRAPTQTAVVGVAITPMVHSWLHATPDSIKVRTTLPAGLSAHPATGTISGTPTDTTSMIGIMVVGYACNDSSVIYDSLWLRFQLSPLSSTQWVE